MKPFTEEQKMYIFRSLEPRGNAIMNMVTQRPDLCWDNNIKELELIRDILGCLIDEEETIKGVITAPKSQLEDAIEFATNWCEQLNNK
jgi:hypothetical protein